MRIKRRIRIYGIIFFFLWSLFVLYPNPANLGISIYRIFNPPVNAQAKGIEEILEKLPASEPAEIEELVKGKFPYFYDWHTYNMPWYFPAVEEALLQRQGDCKTRAIILSSVFEFHGIPYTFMASPSHVWVSYEKKKEKTSNEKDEMALFSLSRESQETSSGITRSKKKLEISFPSIIPWEGYPASFLKAFWDPMPTEKKKSFFIGIVASFFFIFLPEKTERLLLKKDSFI